MSSFVGPLIIIISGGVFIIVCILLICRITRVWTDKKKPSWATGRQFNTGITMISVTGYTENGEACNRNTQSPVMIRLPSYSDSFNNLTRLSPPSYEDSIKCFHTVSESNTAVY